MEGVAKMPSEVATDAVIDAVFLAVESGRTHKKREREHVVDTK